MATKMELEAARRQLKIMESETEGKPHFDSTPKDETKGKVSDEKEEAEEDKTEEGLIIEKADTGKGFQIYRDYTRSGQDKFNRLVRG